MFDTGCGLLAVVKEVGVVGGKSVVGGGVMTLFRKEAVKLTLFILSLDFLRSCL